MNDPNPSNSKTPAQVLVVLGSVRAGRLAPALGAWLLQVAGDCSGLSYELADLADWPLPMDDEPGVPAMGVYAQPHTRAWSAKVAAAQAVVFLTPQYNWGYPAALKNAIDHLYGEWNGKPAVIVTYGGHGGGKCAAQLRQVLEGVKMRPTPTMPQITLSEAAIRKGQFDAQTELPPQAEALRQALGELEAALAGG